MIFKDTYRFSPVIYENDLPSRDDYFHVNPEAIDKDIISSSVTDVAWWNKQKDRCLNGYTVDNVAFPGGDALEDGRDVIWEGSTAYLPEYDIVIRNRAVWISGRMYWYLNFWPIFGIKGDMVFKDIINPKFLLMDYLFFMRWEMCLRKYMDDLELKARQLGFTEKIGGGLVGYNYTFVPASKNIIVAGVEDDSENMFENVVRGLDYIKNTQFYKIRSINKLTDLYIKSKNTKSEVRALTAKDNPQVVSRFSPTLIIYEEIGKWKKGLVKKTKKFVDISLKTETRKTGWAVYIGTGGDMKAGAADLQTIAFNPEKHNIPAFTNRWQKEESKLLNKVGHFTPKWMYKDVDEDGNPFKNRSIALIEKEIENTDPDDQITETSQQACYINQVFLIPGGGFFGEVIVKNLNARLSDIRTHKAERNLVKSYNLSWKNPKNWWDGVIYEISETGFCRILELPETDRNGKVYQNLYGAATDSYDVDEALTSSSKGSCWIYKRFLDANHVYKTWVAGYVERPETSKGGAELFFERTAMLCMLYQAVNLIEWSKIRIIDFYKLKGLHLLLKERPQFVIAAWVNDSKQVNKYGIDPATKPDWLKLLRDHLADPENIQKIYFEELCEAWASFLYDPSGKKYNCDITISTALNIVMEKDEQLVEINDTEQEHKRRPMPVYHSDEYGNLVMTNDYGDN